jgi:predicted PurR-regulated permease PerM
MARIFDADSTLKRLRNRYRLVVMNDDTFEEVVTFKLSRLSVYITLSTIFVLLVGLTVALITFTNLKYYLPGYGTQSQRKELILYKTKIDSLEKASIQKDTYLENLKRVLSGDVKATVDTATLKIPEVEKSTQ